eukprot:m.198215 g.198215  ORF g.198215 m.198215 type:complete len:1030 (+) comp16833_c0_seq1:189-3278(+)
MMSRAAAMAGLSIAPQHHRPASTKMTCILAIAPLFVVAIAAMEVNAEACMSSLECSTNVTYCDSTRNCLACHVCAVYEDEVNGLPCTDVCPEQEPIAPCQSTSSCTAGLTYCDRTLSCSSCRECASLANEINGISCADACNSCLQLSFSPSTTELDLRGRQLTDEEVHCILTREDFPRGLRVLNLAENSLSVCPNISALQQLEEFYAYQNQITNIDHQQWPPSLVWLDLQQNLIRTIGQQSWPPSLGHLWLNQNQIASIDSQQWPSSLKELRLDQNQIASIDNQQWPSVLEQLRLDKNSIARIDHQQWPNSLQYLYLNQNQLAHITNQQWPTSLQALYLHQNHIISIDNQQWPPSLQDLFLYENRITSLDNQQWPDSLQSLSLYMNEITSIENQRWPPSLQQLYLHQNQITSVENQQWPASLQRLFLDENQITGIQNQRWPTSLLELSLSQNQISDITRPAALQLLYLFRNQISSIDGQAWPSSLQGLYVNENEITTIDNQQWPSTLLDLRLYHNNIANIDHQAWPASLQYLYLNENRLTNIDNQAWPTSLRELYLHQNQITSIENQTWPAALRFLYLHQNQLANVDNQQWPRSLTKLYLYENQITSIDNAQLPMTLEALSCHRNLLMSIPAGLERLRHLRQLDLSFNLISTIPAHVAWPPNLASLDLSDNRFQHPVDLNLSSLPASTTTINLDFNPWSRWFEEAYTLESGDTIFLGLTQQLPCFTSDFSMRHPLSPWECSKATFRLSSLAGGIKSLPCVLSDNNATLTDSLSEWSCALNQIGELLIESTDAFRSYSYSQANAKYTRFYVIVFPVCAGVAMLGAVVFALKKGVKGIDWFILILLSLSCFDLASDWAFYAIEITSPGFKDAYECVPSAPIYGCNATQAVYSCEHYGHLHSPCGAGSADQMEGAANECECAGYRCYEDDPHRGLTCEPLSEADYVGDYFHSCDSYGTWDDYINETCGYAVATNPHATGSNECECLGFSCKIIYETQCTGWYGGNYQVLRYSCLISCFLATVIFVAAWCLKL